MMPYNSVKNGELAGSATAVQFPNVPCRYVLVKPVASNAGNVYIGGSAAVTVADGTTDTTTGLQVSPTSGPLIFEISNLNMLWRICDNAGDDLTYMAMG